MRMKARRALGAAVVLLAACAGAKNTVDSNDLPEARRVETLAKYMTLKSAVNEAAYRLFNVNLDGRGVPGASSADYMICLTVAPGDVEKWTKGRESEIAPAPLPLDWTAAVLDRAAREKLSALAFVVYRDEKAGYTYTMWVNRERGVILIRYIVR